MVHYLGNSFGLLYHFNHSHHVPRCYATVGNNVQVQALRLPELQRKVEPFENLCFGVISTTRDMFPHKFPKIFLLPPKFLWYSNYPNLVHKREHLQSQHILSQIVPMFSDDLYQLTSDGSRIFALKLQPQRRLGGRGQSHDCHMTH